MNVWRPKSSSAIFVAGCWKLSSLTRGPPGASVTARAAPAESNPPAASTPERARLIVFIASLPKISIQTLDPRVHPPPLPLDRALCAARTQAQRLSHDRNSAANCLRRCCARCSPIFTDSSARYDCERISRRRARFDPHPARVEFELRQFFGIHLFDQQPVLKQPDTLVVDCVPRVDRKRDGDRQQFDTGERQHQPGAVQDQQERDSQRKQRKRDDKNLRTGVATRSSFASSATPYDWLGCPSAMALSLPSPPPVNPARTLTKIIASRATN